MTIERKKKKRKPIFQAHSKNYVNSFLSDIDKCKNSKDKDKVFDKYLICFDTFIKPLKFIKGHIIAIMCILI